MPLPPYYNPCSDGLPAKAWECLRRNSEFRRLLNRERAIPLQSRAMSWMATTANEQNHLASAALCYLLPTQNIESTQCVDVTNPQVNEDMPWPQTPSEFRGALERALSFHLPLPIEISPPPVEAMGRLASSDGRAPLVDWLAEANRTWRNYDVVAVPKFVRDTEHRKSIEKDLRERVRVTARKGRTFTDKGSAFGTEREWDIFLFVERQMALGDSKLAAWRKAAVEFYGGTALASKKLLTPEKFAQIADQTDTRQSTHIANRVAAVERSVNDAYPVLKAFV